MKKANSFTAPRFRVESNRHRLIKTFECLSDAIDFAEKGRGRIVYMHNRPAFGTEGNYSLINTFGG